MFYGTDHDSVTGRVEDLINSAGFDPVRTGTLARADVGHQEAGGELYGKEYQRIEASAAVARLRKRTRTRRRNVKRPCRAARVRAGPPSSATPLSGRDGDLERACQRRNKRPDQPASRRRSYRRAGRDLLSREPRWS